MAALVDDKRNPLATHRFFMSKTVHDSKAITASREPSIVISASGMATGGRILHHLKKRLPDERNTVIFVGYQSEGTRGRRLLDGEKEIRIHGQMVPVRAHIENLPNLSAHADYHEILRWLSGFKRAPKTVFLVHGEPPALEEFGKAIHEEMGLTVVIPEPRQGFEL